MYKITNRKIFGKQFLTFLLIVVALIIGITSYVAWQWLFKKTVNINSKEIILYVKTNQTFDELLYQLTAQQIIKHQQGFKQLAGWFKLQKKLKPGRYIINEPLTNLELIKILIGGKQATLNITFNYAERIEDVAVFFSTRIEADNNELLKLLKDTVLLNQIGFDTANIISLFIPNTYNFYWNTSAQELISRMLKEYNRFWNDERKSKADSINFSPQQVVTIASIVQKETNKTDEMSKIAGVYINRLEKGIPLQADPTIIFMLNDKTIKRVKSKHYTIPSPYNTYLNKGLPPGPICTPSPQVIDAVLNYTPHNYYYFCAKDDFSGYHAFAKNLDEHLINARKYQKALNKLGIM
ncbi:MAG: endolytic transglycosylase MltG [Bacteroidia bacterium]